MHQNTANTASSRCLPSFTGFYWVSINDRLHQRCQCLRTCDRVRLSDRRCCTWLSVSVGRLRSAMTSEISQIPLLLFFFLLYHPINRSNRERSRTSVVFFLSLGRPVPTRSLMGAHFVDRCWQMFFFYFFIFFWPELVRYVNRIAHRLLIDDPFLFACVLLLVSFTGFYWVLLGFAGPWTG